MSRIMVAMSGGVDSSVAALLLKNGGHDIAGGTLILHQKQGEDGKSCGTNEDVLDAASVCEKLGIKHYTFDKSAEFSEKVKREFANIYRMGETPNPCILCNQRVKFPEMIESALSLGYDLVATGHYAEIREENGRYLLIRPADRSKDQTYVLYGLTQFELSHLCFPLGKIESKEKARALAEESRLINARKPDSQDICFVPDKDYSAFIDRFLGQTEQKADFVTPDGKHIKASGGITDYTIGQRKGLGVAFGRPQFVIGKSAEKREVYLGDEKELFTKTAIVKDLNFISISKLTDKMSVTAKTRYSQKEATATISPLMGGEVLLEFDEPQRAMTPGQAAVFFDRDVVVGGGIIKNTK